MGTRSPIEVLKRGLKVLETQIEAKRRDLVSKVKARVKISSEEEEWLDHGGGNTVDEVYLINELEMASDYERALGRLDKKSNAIMQKLQELAGDIVKVVAGNKRKRRSNFKLMSWSH
jgi:hypothetical protein